MCIKEREEAELLEEQKRRQIEAEMARLEREAEERERQRKLEEHKEIQRKVAKERLEQLKSTTLGARAFADLSEDVSMKYCLCRVLQILTYKAGDVY